MAKVKKNKAAKSPAKAQPEKVVSAQVGIPF